MAGANIKAANGDTIVPAGGTAVLYPGSDLDFMPGRLTEAWGSGINLIPVQGFTSLTATDAIGLWPSYAAYSADAIPMATSSPRRTFDNATVTLNYASGFPDVGANSGRSIAWNGSGSFANGANWVESQAGENGAPGPYHEVTSSETFIENAQINSTNDLGNPGLLPPGAATTGLWITEIMFAPESPLVAVGFSESDFEWVELYNDTAAPIDFAATPYVFDDSAGTALASANVSTGKLAVGEVGILFRGGAITADDMAAIWGESINFIPVTNWPFLNNNGGDTIAIWGSLTDYASEPVPGTGRTHQNAVAVVTYDTVAANGWPTSNDQSSIYLSDLSADPDSGASWTRSGAAGDSLSFPAQPIYQTATDHPGGDVGSPG